MGRYVQVPGGSRYTRAGGLCLGEEELWGEGILAMLLLTMIMMVLMVIWQRWAGIGLEEGGLKRERRKQWFLRKLIQRSITSLKLPGPDASVSSSSLHQVLQALSRNACDINVGSTLVTVGAVEANFSHGVAEESHRLI